MTRSFPRAPRALSLFAAVMAVAATCVVPVAAAQGIQRDAAIISEAVSSRVDAFIYKVNTRSRLEFRGTTLAPRAFATAKVSAEPTRTLVEAQFEKLPQPGELGPYTVYVLWAITPEGRASSLGILELAKSGKADIEVGTPLNGFAMIVTAEPHFLVSVPSTQVVMRNVAVEFTGRTQPITTLADRADYGNLQKLAPASKRPIEVDQATYAVAIAAAAGAEERASGPFATATAALAGAEAAWRSKKSAERKRAPELGRVAVQAGEDARVAALRRADELRQADAQKQAAEAQRLAAESQKNAEQAAALALAEAARARDAEGSAARARADLLARMNQVLPTRDTPRGLVAEIGGVLFATGKATLSVAARESLARLSGVLSAYPGLKQRIEGYTDTTGSEATNLALSNDRAIAVRDYLIAQGVPASNVEVAGLGPANPIADNATAEGRARNRRVEVIVSGEGISPKR